MGIGATEKVGGGDEELAPQTAAPSLNESQPSGVDQSQGGALTKDTKALVAHADASTDSSATLPGDVPANKGSNASPGDPTLGKNSTVGSRVPSADVAGASSAAAPQAYVAAERQAEVRIGE